MRILNPEQNPGPLKSLLNRKIQFEIDGHEFAVLRALIGASRVREEKLQEIINGLHDTFKKAVPHAEYSIATKLVVYNQSTTLTMRDNNIPEQENGNSNG